MSTCSATQNLHPVLVRTRQRTIAFTVLVLVIGAFAYVILSEKPEPRYQGKRLSEWLAIHSNPNSSEGAEAAVAVRSIGTNALPFVLEWMRYEPPPWREKLRTVASSPRIAEALAYIADALGYTVPKDLFVGESSKQADDAAEVIYILRSNAISAIPELEALMKDNRTPVRGRRAIRALGKIGPPAIPVLTNALTDPNQINRA